MAEVQPSHLVVGLGNPGPRYQGTRHNVGFRVVDRALQSWGGSSWRASCHSLVAQAAVEGQEVRLAKPHTFMNRSGRAVRELREQTGVEISRLVVVHDDLDLPFGRLRIRPRGGHGGHNGIRSVLEWLGTEEFVRLKVGIGRSVSGRSVVEHVLEPFGEAEAEQLPDLIGRAVEALRSIIVEGPERAMSSLPN